MTPNDRAFRNLLSDISRRAGQRADLRDHRLVRYCSGPGVAHEVLRCDRSGRRVVRVA